MVYRKEKFAPWKIMLGDIHWAPTEETWVALASYLLVVASLSLAFRVFTTARVAANFIVFGPVTLALVGVGIPTVFTVLRQGRGIQDLGITLRQLVPSLALGLVLGWDTYRETLGRMDWQPTRAAIPLISMAATVGIFEAVFFRGWLQLRLERAFGVVPGLLLASLCYSLYHIGYGMTGGEMLFLFGLGITFAAVFRLTRNVFVLWPFYTPVGSLYTNVTDGLTMPFEATYGFLLTLGMIAAIIAAASILRRSRSRKGAAQ
jgi:membrane protease YdiL (CAAX protease family)